MPGAVDVLADAVMSSRRKRGASSSSSFPPSSPPPAPAAAVESDAAAPCASPVSCLVPDDVTIHASHAGNPATYDVTLHFAGSGGTTERRRLNVREIVALNASFKAKVTAYLTGVKQAQQQQQQQKTPTAVVPVSPAPQHEAAAAAPLPSSQDAPAASLAPGESLFPPPPHPPAPPLPLPAPPTSGASADSFSFGIESWPPGSLQLDPTGGRWKGAKRFRAAMSALTKETQILADVNGFGDGIFSNGFMARDVHAVTELLFLQATQGVTTGAPLHALLFVRLSTTGEPPKRVFACETTEQADAWLLATYPKLAGTDCTKVLAWRSPAPPNGLGITLDTFLSVMAARGEAEGGGEEAVEHGGGKRKAEQELQQLRLKHQRLEHEAGKREEQLHTLLQYHRQLMRTLTQVHLEAQRHRQEVVELRKAMAAPLATMGKLKETFAMILQSLDGADAAARALLTDPQHMQQLAQAVIHDTRWVTCQNELMERYNVDLNRHAIFHPPGDAIPAPSHSSSTAVQQQQLSGMSELFCFSDAPVTPPGSTANVNEISMHNVHTFVVASGAIAAAASGAAAAGDAPNSPFDLSM